MKELLLSREIGPNTLAEALVQETEKYLGYKSVPWIHGISDRSSNRSPQQGFDCSGLIVYGLEAIGYPLPENLRYAHELHEEEFGKVIPAGFQQRGDLVFFSYSGQRASHVGIMANDYTYIHAPGRKNTVVSIEELFFSPIPTPRQQNYPPRYFRDPEYFSEERKYLLNPIGFKRPSYC